MTISLFQLNPNFQENETKISRVPLSVLSMACAERYFPFLRRYLVESITTTASVELWERLLDRGWKRLLTNIELDSSDNELLKECERNVPDEIHAIEHGFPHALEAAILIIRAVESTIHNNSKSIVLCLNRCYELLDHAVIDILDSSELEKQSEYNEDRIAQHPLILAEQNRIQIDLDDIVFKNLCLEDVNETVSRIRQRSVYDSFQILTCH